MTESELLTTLALLESEYEDLKHQTTLLGHRAAATKKGDGFKAERAEMTGKRAAVLEQIAATKKHLAAVRLKAVADNLVLNLPGE